MCRGATLLIDLLVSFGDPKDTRRSIKNKVVNIGLPLYYETVSQSHISLDEKVTVKNELCHQ